MIATIKFAAVMVLSAVTGWLTAAIIITPAVQMVISAVVGVVFCFISSIYICNKLGVK